MTTVADLIARYRAAEAKMNADLGDDSGNLDPTRVWTGEEFAIVLAAAENAEHNLVQAVAYEEADISLIARAPEMLALLRRLAVVSYDAELGRSGPGCSECGGLEGHVGHTGEFGLDPCQLAKFLAEIEAQT